MNFVAATRRGDVTRLRRASVQCFYLVTLYFPGGATVQRERSGLAVTVTDADLDAVVVTRWDGYGVRACDLLPCHLVIRRPRGGAAAGVRASVNVTDAADAAAMTRWQGYGVQPSYLVSAGPLQCSGSVLAFPLP